MKASDLTELAVRNLREALLRNTLTTLGVGVGVASLVAMLSLGVGLQQLASRRLASTGLFDTVFVTSKANLRGFGRRETSNGPSSRASSESRDRESSAKPTDAAETGPSTTARLSAVNVPNEFRRLDDEARQEIERLPNVVE